VSQHSYLHTNKVIKHEVKLNAVIKSAVKQVPAISSYNMNTLQHLAVVVVVLPTSCLQ